MRHPVPTRAGLRAVALLAAVAAAAAGCSSSGGSGPNSSAPAQGSAPAGGGGSSAAAPSAPAGTGGGTATATDLVSYVGGKAGKADSSLAPVTIGYINQQGGPIAAPDATAGARAAVKLVNAELGGIGGHPLKLSTCFVINDESEGQKCAQQFANDSDISLIVRGFMIVGSASFTKVINGSKPILGSVATTPVDLTAKDTYFINGTNPDNYGGLASYAKSKGWDSLTVAIDNSPSGQVTANSVRKAFGKQGITVHVASFPVGTANLVGPLVAAKAQSSDVLAVFGIAPVCISFAKAVQQLKLTDKPTLSIPPCIDPSVQKALGDFPEWTYTVSVNPFDTADPQVAQFNKSFDNYGAGKPIGGWTAPTFEAVLSAAKMLNEAGGAKATPEQVTKKIKSFAGPVFLGPNKLECGWNPAEPSSCLTASKVQTYHGDGKWVTDGYFSAPKN